MLKYLVVLLDDTSTSYCHYENEKTEPNLISLENLKAGILFAMKENLMIQFIYPEYELPIKYKETIHSIDHSKIVPINSQEQGDIIVIKGESELLRSKFNRNKTYVLRLQKEEFFKNFLYVKRTLNEVLRLNVVISNIETFDESDFSQYRDCLKELSLEVERMYTNGRSPQLNLLTDRMMLTAMNNCNAGYENITLAPDGKFYVCPAFYLASDEEDYGLGKSRFSIGNLNDGLDIKNPQLYKLSHAPICRNCDAYQCKRCVWLNRKMTYEVNTPSHEQCVVAHLERNASRDLLHNIRKYGEFLPNMEIEEIEYLDPFDIRKEW